MNDDLRKGMYANDLAMIADKKTRTTGSVGEMEGGVQEARTDNEPGEDRRDVGLTSERGLNISLDDKEFKQVDGFV